MGVGINILDASRQNVDFHLLRDSGRPIGNRTMRQPTRLQSVATLLTLVLSTAIPSYADTEPGPGQSLFDGRSLDGWSHDGKHWRVENGAIVGEIPPGTTLSKNTWIVWQGGVLTDFDLRLRFKLTGAEAANSGIQIRCQVRDVDHVSGYQADLDMGATWLGRIYDEHGRALLVERGQRVLIDDRGNRQVEAFAPAAMFAPIFRERDWNDYRIVGVGSRLAVYINGTLFSELVDLDADAQDASGKLAFQLHSGPETRVEFRDIHLETLSASDARLASFPITPRAATPQRPSTGALPRDANRTPLNLDFEAGDLRHWKATGNAFRGQPVSKDSIAQRWSDQVSNKQGQFFVGGYEVALSDADQGTLTSPWFQVSAPYGSFLVGGGSSQATRVDVLLRGDSNAEEVVFSASGDQREQMRRVAFDLTQYVGRSIAVRLVDESSGGWGHLNFDDFRFHKTRPVPDPTPDANPLHSPLLHHLVDNPGPANINGDTLAKMSVPAGFSVDLIAAEPVVHQPMAFCFDAQGRLWVVEGHSYPAKRPEGQGLDRVLILEDQDHDGTFESKKVFTEGLNLVSGMQVGHGGVWIGAAPELLFIPDRDRDDVPDGPPEVLLNGFGYADTHETINSFTWGPDGWLYGNQGVFNQSRIGKPEAQDAERTSLSAGVWRYHPTRHEFEVFAHGGSNQWGLDFDEHGQLFMTHCRSNWGRGPTTHVIQGGHYWTQLNTGYASFISASPLDETLNLRNYLLASARYGHGEGGAGKHGSRALYGGHSHVGTMIYLGDNWPASYRNHLFTHNLHGHRINHQINLREDSGYNTVHAGFDVFHCADPQYIGVDLQYGPDGAVYISDWYDPRHCHSPHTEQWQRGNGRLYRMQYEGFTPANVNYVRASDLELAEAQLHLNDWHVRMARLELAARAATRPIHAQAIERLEDIAKTHAESARRLRAIWCLYVAGELDAELAQRGLEDESEYVRGWTLQLLVDSERISERGDLITSLLGRESSPLVKIYLVSAASRLPESTAWTILETLAGQPANARDRALPLLLWHTLAQLLPSDVARAERLIDTTRIPALSHYLRWYLPQVSHEARERLTDRLVRMDETTRLESLRLFAAGLKGARDLRQPAGWDSLAKQLYEDDTTRGPAEQLGAAFGDPNLYGRMRKVLSDKTTDWPRKRHALVMLANDQSAATLPLLLQAIDVPQLRPLVLRQIGSHDDPRVANALLARLPKLQGTEFEAAMEILCSRPSSAIALLDAMQAERVQGTRLTGFHARQLANLGDEAVNNRLSRQWGKSGRSTAETQAAIQTLVKAYRKAPLWAYDRNAGARHFRQLCASCHDESENARRIGPKLAGTGAKGIEYVVENLLDPNAVIGKDFLARNIVTVDGRVITGVILGETSTAATVRTATKTETIARSQVEEIIVSENSFMPEGLLNQLNDRERIELLMYLMSLK